MSTNDPAGFRLLAARERVAKAWENCPHWDYETDGEPDGDAPCCVEVREARAAVRAARREAKR